CRSWWSTPATPRRSTEIRLESRLPSGVGGFFLARRLAPSAIGIAGVRDGNRAASAGRAGHPTPSPTRPPREEGFVEAKEKPPWGGFPMRRTASVYGRRASSASSLALGSRSCLVTFRKPRVSSGQARKIEDRVPTTAPIIWLRARPSSEPPPYRYRASTDRK